MGDLKTFNNTKVKQDLTALFDQIDFIVSESRFKEKHSFSLKEFIAKSKCLQISQPKNFTIKNTYYFSAKSIEAQLKKIADHFEEVAFDTGIVKTTGGSVSIVGSGMAIAGLLLAPFTFGASTGLTIAGAATGAAGGITSLTGNVVQMVNDNKDAKKVIKEIDSHGDWEKIVNEEFEKLRVSLK